MNDPSLNDPTVPVTELPVVDDERFMENVREALANGYDRLCARCGAGTYDGYEIHETACPESRREA